MQNHAGLTDGRQGQRFDAWSNPRPRHCSRVVLANVKKGDPVYAECRVSEGSYEKDGVKIYTTDIIANMFDRLVHKGKDVED